MPLFTHANENAQQAGDPTLVGTFNGGTGNREHGNAVYITGLEQPLQVEHPLVKPYFNGALTNVVVNVLTSEAYVHLIEVSNIAATDGFLQLFDGVPAAVTLGTTAPQYSFLVPKGDATNRGGMDKILAVPLHFPNGLSAAFTTTATGNSAVATAGVVNMAVR